MENRTPKVTVITFVEWKMLQLLDQTPVITHFPSIYNRNNSFIDRKPALYVQTNGVLRYSQFFPLFEYRIYHEIQDFRGSSLELLQETGAKI